LENNEEESIKKLPGYWEYSYGVDEIRSFLYFWIIYRHAGILSRNQFMRTQKDNILNSFPKCLKVKHSFVFSNKYYREHLHRNNLYGLSKMLSDYGIENKCLKFANKEAISNIETPFIAHIRNDFVIVKNIAGDKAEIIWRGTSQSTNLADFCSSWSGVVLLAEANEKSVEPEYKDNRKSELFADIQTYTLFFMIGVFIVTWYVKQMLFNNIGLNILLGLNLLGGFIGFFINQKINQFKKSDYIDVICSLFGGKRGCNNILQSKAAKFLGKIRK